MKLHSIWLCPVCRTLWDLLFTPLIPNAQSMLHPVHTHAAPSSQYSHSQAISDRATRFWGASCSARRAGSRVAGRAAVHSSLACRLSARELTPQRRSPPHQQMPARFRSDVIQLYGPVLSLLKLSSACMDYRLVLPLAMHPCSGAYTSRLHEDSGTRFICTHKQIV
jgi:hypothetical protein